MPTSIGRPATRERSLAHIVAEMPSCRRSRFIESLTPNTVGALPHFWPLWSRPEQRPPPTGWHTWLILGGRGSGKTRSGAEWIRSQAEGGTPLARGKARRMALLGETIDQARDIMVLGDSGLMAITPRDRRPVFHVSRNRLHWPNGAEAFLFSASDPESLRGPQFDAAWCDELAKWKRTRTAWDQLQFGLRLGSHPRAVVTTTPRANPTLVAIMEDPGTALTHMPTADNAANLAPTFLRRMQSRYAGGALGRQELMGELLLENPDALWTRALIEDARIGEAPPLDRIVVAVDPPVTARTGSDACGIIVAGMQTGEMPTATVLADWSVQGVGPSRWAARAIAAYHAHQADRLVAEVNQGGDMVGEIVRNLDSTVAFKPVRATRGKALRAEPVAALYEQGRVKHLAAARNPLTKLEDQMTAFGPSAFTGDTKSPDRVDALVWAITDLLLTRRSEPEVRGL